MTGVQTCALPISAFLRELMSMPRRHIVVFFYHDCITRPFGSGTNVRVASHPHSGAAGRDAVPVPLVDGGAVQAEVRVNLIFLSRTLESKNNMGNDDD